MPPCDPDIYLACWADVNGWGGGLSRAASLQGACQTRGLRTHLLGIGPQPSNGHTAPDRHNVSLPTPRGLWRVRNWFVVKQLERQLQRVPPPRVAVVANSPFWTVAAKTVWPQTQVVYSFPCLLSHCLPFTWPQRRPTDIWSRLNFRAIRRIEHRAFSLADTTVVGTATNAEEITAFHPAVRERLLISPLDCARFDPPPKVGHIRRTACEWDASRFVVLLAGVCDRNKAFDHAIEAWPNVAENGVLAIVGDGPERLKWVQRAEQLGLGQRIRFMNPTADMGPWLAAADAVLSSSYYDAYPNVIREALAAGKPALVPAHDPPHVYAGIADTVAAARAGITYDRRDPRSLAHAVNELMQASTDFGANGRDYANTHFAWDDLIDAVTTKHQPGDRRRPARPQAQRLRDATAHESTATTVAGPVSARDAIHR
jgi:glycosyltransferase involved in cell wall biosynthesis